MSTPPPPPRRPRSDGRDAAREPPPPPHRPRDRSRAVVEPAEPPRPAAAAAARSADDRPAAVSARRPSRAGQRDRHPAARARRDRRARARVRQSVRLRAARACSRSCSTSGSSSVVVTSLAYSLIAINPITGLPTNSQRGFDATLALGRRARARVRVGRRSGVRHDDRKAGAGTARLRGARRPGRARARVLARAAAAARRARSIGGCWRCCPPTAGSAIWRAARSSRARTWRGSAPLIGWVLVVDRGGMPFILAGMPRTFASMHRVRRVRAGARRAHLGSTCDAAACTLPARSRGGGARSSND